MTQLSVLKSYVLNNKYHEFLKEHTDLFPEGISNSLFPEGLFPEGNKLFSDH